MAAKKTSIALDPQDLLRYRKAADLRGLSVSAFLKDSADATLATPDPKADLRAFAADSNAAGHATLAAVPAPQLGGQSVQSVRYHRAIALYAKAELIERHPDFDTTAAGGAEGNDAATAIGSLRRNAMHAVRDMLGVTRTVVDLI